jgi:antitoxin component YwqK of YwqJK toxin-antitoxin module
LYGNVIFRNGTGKIIEVNDEGVIMLETNYVNHCQSGVQTYYYNSGKKYLVIVWKCSENSSGESLLWEAVARYDEKGNSLPKGTLKNGNGTFIYFDYEKRKTFEETYKNGKMISQRELK